MASAATELAVKARSPPSTFSALLRRSKFASYDPKIGQIYTTFDGHAHRGDWGLKRPLAMRRRDARIDIRHVDTLYQQTDYRSAYTDTTFVRKFNELGIVPKTPTRDSSWASRSAPWVTDSDFASSDASHPDVQARENILHTPRQLPDPRVMSDKRFSRYERKIRRLAPEFEDFLQEKQRRVADLAERQRKLYGSKPRTTNRGRDGVTSLGTYTVPEPVPLPPSQMAANPNLRYHRDFIAGEFLKEAEDSQSDRTFVNPLAHPMAGLTYTHGGELQSILDTKPVIGRRLNVLPYRDTANVLSLNAAVGGFIGTEEIKKDKEKEKQILSTDFGTRDGAPRTDGEAGIAAFRAVKSIIVDPPTVVGPRPKRLVKGSLRLTFIDWDGFQQSRERNPHRPGSVKYVKHNEPKIAKEPHYKLSPATGNMSRKPLDTRKTSVATTEAEKRRSSLLTRIKILSPTAQNGDDLI